MRAYEVIPVAKPRMTGRDKWLKPARKPVAAYWAYKAHLRALGATYSNGESMLYIIPMPKSWSKKKKAEMDGMPHTQTPDADNLEKAYFDAVFDEDKHIWHVGRKMKIWGYGGKIIIGADQIMKLIRVEGKMQ